MTTPKDTSSDKPKASDATSGDSTTTTTAPTTATASTKAATAASSRRSVVIDNPHDAYASYDAPPVPVDPLELLHRIALGLERVARSEAAKAQPSARDWAQLRRDLVPMLQAAGFDVPNAAVAASGPIRRQPLVGARSPGSIAKKVGTRVDIGASPYTAKSTTRRGAV